WLVLADVSAASSNDPPRSASRIEANTLGASKHGQQYQSMVPSVPTRATVRRSPISPWSAIGRERGAVPRCCLPLIRVSFPAQAAVNERRYPIGAAQMSLPPRPARAGTSPVAAFACPLEER